MWFTTRGATFFIFGTAVVLQYCYVSSSQLCQTDAFNLWQRFFFYNHWWGRAELWAVFVQLSMDRVSVNSSERIFFILFDFSALFCWRIVFVPISIISFPSYGTKICSEMGFVIGTVGPNYLRPEIAALIFLWALTGSTAPSLNSSKIFDLLPRPVILIRAMYCYV